MKNSIEIGNRLCTARKNAGLSIGQTRKIVECEKGLLENLEKGDGNLDLVFLYKLAYVYQVSSRWIMTGKTQGKKELKEMLKKLNRDDCDKIIALLSTLSTKSNYTPGNTTRN